MDAQKNGKEKLRSENCWNWKQSLCLSRNLDSGGFKPPESSFLTFNKSKPLVWTCWT